VDFGNVLTGNFCEWNVAFLMGGYFECDLFFLWNFFFGGKWVETSFQVD
jgi:hypothetical protein